MFRLGVDTLLPVFYTRHLAYAIRCQKSVAIHFISLN